MSLQRCNSCCTVTLVLTLPPGVNRNSGSVGGLLVGLTALLHVRLLSSLPPPVTQLGIGLFGTLGHI
ncbi:hypothetical protein FKM82_000272 [Ascaphus truei]